MELDLSRQDKISTKDFVWEENFDDSVLFQNARWKVMISHKFRESFGKLNTDFQKKVVVSLLLRLANGWRPKRAKIDFLCSTKSSMFLKKFKVQALYVVCSVDVLKEVWYFQVLKVWDILPLEEIPSLVEHLDAIFALYTDEYISRCNVKCLEGDLEVPMSWDPTNYLIRYKSCDRELDTFEGEGFPLSSKVNGSILLMKFYSLSSGIARHLLAGCNGKEVGLPFVLSDEETEMVHYTGSCFILGRSGTGKSSVLIAKLCQREQLHHISMEGFHGYSTEADGPEGRRDEDREANENMKGACLRQLFVTVNPKLCSAVRQNIALSKRSSCGPECLCKRSSDVDVEVGNNDDLSHFSRIPDSFSELSPNSYPLVISFSEFLMMLDGTLSSSFFEKYPDAGRLSYGRQGVGRTVALDTFLRTKKVTFEKFASSYWPHFNVQSTKGLDPSKVFIEIISHIKGGAELNDLNHTRDSYISLSKRRVSTIDKTARERVYDIFLHYEKQKKQNGEFDLADLVNDLHFRLKNELYKGDLMDFVYVDEVQDLTMRSISLLKYVCRNYEEGYVFSGDTAQAINEGVHFRFEDIGSLFYTKFVEEPQCLAKSREKKHQTARMFHLRQNFRTHDGVLKLASSVINLIYHFFPNTIDVLEPEGSPISGEAPELLMANDDEFRSVFGNISKMDMNVVGFGADQVILVRDDGSKRRILNVVKENALVLTIMECKGLEFQDVLVYNFFGSSPQKLKWRLLYQYMKEKNLADSSLASPCFNVERDFTLCSELKQLYVAITRTRQRLWFLERDCEFPNPIFDYWLRLSVIKTRRLDSRFVKEIQVASSCEDWRSQGVKLFDKQNYEMAKICFHRAGETNYAKWAEAEHLQATSNQIRDSSPKMAHTYLRQAADIYLSIGKAERAAQCFCDLEEYKQAAKIYLDNFGDSKLREAAECFHLAGCYKQAAQLFSTCKLYPNCLSACADGKLYDIGLQYISSWRECFARNAVRSNEIECIALKFLKKVSCHYHRRKDYSSMLKYVRAFNSKEYIRTFLKDWGDYHEAAHVARRIGYTIFAVELLEKAGCFDEASKSIVQYVFSESLWGLGSNGWPLKSFSGKDDLLAKAISLSKQVSKYFHELICLEAVTLSDKLKSLKESECHFRKAQQCNNISGKILTARRILDAHLSLDSIVSDSATLPSLNTLLYWWDCWKDQIVKVRESLERLGTVQDCYAEFCLNYFGAWICDAGKDTIIVLQNPEAIWVRMSLEFGKQRVKKLESCGVQQFVAAVRAYWLSEIHSVGLNVLNYLNGLYKFAVKYDLPMHVQSFVLTQILRSAEFLSRSQLQLHSHNFYHNLLERFLDLTALKLLENLNQLDFRHQMLDMALLRDNSLRELVEEIIFRNSEFNSDTNLASILNIIAVILGSKHLSFKVCRRIEETFRDDQLWGPVMESIVCKGESNSKYSFLVSKLHEAVTIIYDRKCNWTPPSLGIFINIIERILVSVFCSKGFFFMPRSAVVDWLISCGWNAASEFILVMDSYSSTEVILDSVACIVEQLLVNRKDTLKWSGRDHDSVSYALLVMRLVVIVCIICVNTGKYIDLFAKLLSRRDITALLPWEFFVILAKRSREDYLDASILVEAMKSIGNPMVLVQYERCGPKCPKAINLDVKTIYRKHKFLQVLFPQESAHHKQRKACQGVYHLRKLGHQWRTKTRDGGGYKSYHQFWETLESIVNTETQLSEIDLVSQASSAKAVVLDTILHVTGSICSTDSSANMTIDALQQLYSSLDSRESIAKAKTRPLIEYLLAERPNLQSSCSELFSDSTEKSSKEKEDGAGGDHTRKRISTVDESGKKFSLEVKETQESIADLEAYIPLIKD